MTSVPSKKHITLEKQALELAQALNGPDYHCVAGRLVQSTEYQELLRVLMILAKI